MSGGKCGIDRDDIYFEQMIEGNSRLSNRLLPAMDYLLTFDDTAHRNCQHDGIIASAVIKEPGVVHSEKFFESRKRSHLTSHRLAGPRYAPAPPGHKKVRPGDRTF